MFSKALLVALTTLAVSVAANPIPAASTGCAAVHVITARGSTEPPGEGAIGSVVDLIVSKSTQTVSREAIVYPATMGANDYWSSEAQGQLAMKSRIAATVSACPHTKIVLTGYSQGGEVTGDVLASKAPGTENVYAAIMMGDPGHVHGEHFQEGTANGVDGLFPRTIGALQPFNEVLHSYCDLDDPYCAGGTNHTVHHIYFAKYGAQASDFVVGRLGERSTHSP